jgi:hypothetical protein
VEIRTIPIDACPKLFWPQKAQKYKNGLVILQPTLEDGVAHEVDAAREVELSHRVGFVDFYGLDAQGEAGGNLFVAVTERDETQDF